MRKRNSLVVASVAAVVLLFSGLGVANASQSTYPWDSIDIKNQSLKSVDLAPNSVGKSETSPNSVGTSEIEYQGVGGLDVKNSDLTGVDVKDKSLTTKDLSDATVATLSGNDGDDGADGVVVPVVEKTDFVNVANIGGSFKTNATLAGTLTLPEGTYLVNVHGFFKSNQTTSGNADLQVALRGGWNGVDTFGYDFGTGFTGGSPVQANREVTASSAWELVVLPEETTLQGLVFGYDGSGQGAADSGKFDAQVTITALPVQTGN